MRIPQNTLRTSHLRTYGSTGLDADTGTPIAGCPALYKAKYVEFKLKEPRSFPLEFGTLIHDALYLAEEEDLALVPDALDKAWSRSDVPLDAAAYQEALDDLTAYMERGGLNL